MTHKCRYCQHSDVERSSIQLAQETRQRLKRIGNKGESYDDLLRRLIDEAGYPETE